MKTSQTVMSQEEIRILNGCLGHPQGLSLVLDFQMPCRTGAHSRRSRAMTGRATESLTELFGSHTTDKPEVAAHEAGHGVIAHLAGYHVKNVGVWMDVGNRWAGRVEADSSNAGGADDSWLWRDGLVRIAGYVGECLSGMNHPTIAVHEKLHCLAIGRYLDERAGKTDYHFTLAVTQCREALEANQRIFDEVCYRLLATNRVSGTELNSLMEGATPLPASPIDVGGSKDES